MKITLLPIGKMKSRPLGEVALDYSARIPHYAPFEIAVCRDERQALSRLNPSDLFIVLDERGKQMSSTQLADFISEQRMRGAKRAVFLIGGPDGLSEEAIKKADFALSLSSMTLPHELAQVVLLEQLYRALTIIKGEPYHRS